MTSTARDLRYGRRGGGWAEHATGELASEVARTLRVWRSKGGTIPDRTDLFHPETIALSRAHAARPECPANKPTSPGPCDCIPDPADLEAVWLGRARMADARRAAGRPLDDVDIEALARKENS